MLKELKAKATSAAVVKAVKQLIINQNAIITTLRSGGKTEEEAEAINDLFKEQE